MYVTVKNSKMIPYNELPTWCLFIYYGTLYFKIPSVEYMDETCGVININTGTIIGGWSPNCSIIVQPISNHNIVIEDAWDAPEVSLLHDIKPGEGWLCDNDVIIRTEKVQFQNTTDIKGGMPFDKYEFIILSGLNSEFAYSRHSFATDVINNRKGLKFTKMRIEL